MSRNKWKTQYDLIEQASNFHNKVRDIFRFSNYFKRFHCYQEVNVKDLINDYADHNHHYDWYIQELNIILELHGDQHYKITNYGSIDYGQAFRAFKNIQYRDNLKKQAALDANYSYVEIPYKFCKKLNETLLIKILTEQE